jgi:hypothetical protein
MSSAAHNVHSDWVCTESQSVYVPKLSYYRAPQLSPSSGTTK